MSSAAVAGVVLAAGSALRMGGEDKLLLQLDAEPLVRWPIAALRGAGVAPIMVVGAAPRGALWRLLEGDDVTLLHNAEAASGIGSSVACAAAALTASVDAVVICLGDMPCVRAHHVRALIDAFDSRERSSSSGRSDICVPVYRGQRGNPVLFGARHFGALRGLRGDRGARALIDAAGDAVQRVEVADDGVLIDVDTQDDLRRLVQSRVTRR